MKPFLSFDLLTIYFSWYNRRRKPEGRNRNIKLLPFLIPLLYLVRYFMIIFFALWLCWMDVNLSTHPSISSPFTSISNKRKKSLLNVGPFYTETFILWPFLFSVSFYFSVSFRSLYFTNSSVVLRTFYNIYEIVDNTEILDTFVKTTINHKHKN